MVENDNKEKYSPRKPENWEKFKSWAKDQNFFPDELKDVSSFQEAEERIAKLKRDNEGEKEYFENLHQLLQAVEQLYLNMCVIDDKMRTLSRKE